MLVKAKHNINHGGKWITGGTVFEVADAEYDALRDCVVLVGYVSNVFPPDQPEKPTAAKKRKTTKKEK